MKLLNLWPQGETVIRPVKRFAFEVVFAALVVMLVTLATWLWFDAREEEVVKAHQILQTEWQRVSQQRDMDVLSSAQMPRFMRQVISGERDWMGELPQWSQDGRVRWLSAKLEHSSLLLEGAAQNGAAIEAVAEQIRARYPEPPLSISEITSVTVRGEKWWRFSMRVDGVGLLYRWILTPESAHAASSTSNANPAQVTPAEGVLIESNVPQKAVSTGDAR